MMPHWLAFAGLAGSLALSACTGPGPSRDEPALRFAPAADEARQAGDETARVRRDAHGRPIRFREQRIDRHGVMRDVATGEIVSADDGAPRHDHGNADCHDRGRCRIDGHAGSDDPR